MSAKAWTYLFFILLSPLAFGQQLLVEVSQDDILIGESTTLTLTIKTDNNDSINFRPQLNEIDGRAISSNGALSTDKIAFEIVDPFRDTVIKNGSSKKWKGEYVVTAWDSGLFVIPGATVLINDSSFRFKDISITCRLVPKDTTIDIYEIRENYATIPDKPFSFVEFVTDNWWWLTLIIVAILAFFIIRSRQRRLRDEDEYEEPARPLSLKERTILAIDALEKEELWTKDRLKEHFIELSYILRSYLTSRYSISLLDKTTYETKLLLTKQGLNSETIDVIARILSQSDMVKFAKSKPDLIAILRQSTLAKQIIAETSPLDFDNVD